jgi:hypothetical protein
MFSLENLAQRGSFRKLLWRPIPKNVQVSFYRPCSSFSLDQASALARSCHTLGF